MERIIKKVLINQSNNQMLVTIPKKCHIRPGDYVELIKMPRPIRNKKGKISWKEGD